MKILIVFTSLLLFVSACTEKNNALKDNPDTEIIENFRISGKIEGASELTMHLEAMSQQGKIDVASCQVGSNGEFEMIGNIPGMGLYQLRLGQNENQIITIPLLPLDDVNLFATLENFQSSPVFKGTEWAKTLNKYLVQFNLFISKQQSLADLQGKVPEEELMKKYLTLRKPIDLFCMKTIDKDPSNPINFLLISFLTPSTGFQDWDANNLNVLKKMSEAYLKRYKQSPIASRLAEQITQMEDSYFKYLALNSEASFAPEIALNNPTGKEIKLSSLRGKYVLIDFWASWCAPCRKENPNVVRLYQQYKDKGFTVYSVSLDKNISAWTAAIEKDNLSWPNHVSDLLGWESSMPNLYGFQGIPHTVLIDKDGHILATGLRGESLEQKLSELLK